MIKVFCDLCGTGYDPSHDLNMKGVDNAQHSVALRGASHRELVFTVKVQITTPGAKTDICGACRWRVLNSLDIRPTHSSVDVKV